MSEVRIIVMGSRDFKYYAVISKTLDNFISKLPADKKVVLVSGTCPGADMYGETNLFCFLHIINDSKTLERSAFFE